MPPLRGTEFTDMMADAAKNIGLHPFPGPGGGQFPRPRGRSGLHVSRLLQPWRLPCQRQKLDQCLHHSQSAGDQKTTVVTGAQVTRIEVDAKGRVSGVTYLKGGETYFQPAAAVLLGSLCL